MIFYYSDIFIITTVNDLRTPAIKSLACISSVVNQIDKMLEGRALFRGRMAILILVSRGHGFLGMIVMCRFYALTLHASL